MRRPSSAAQRAVLARAEVSGPLGGDPSEPAVLEFLQRLAALEHGHQLVACGAGRRLFRAAEADSGANERACLQLLADCAEAGALGDAGLCRLLHCCAASGDELTRANAPRAPVAAAVALCALLCALCGQILEQWVRGDRNASQIVLLAAACALTATIAAQLPRCAAQATVQLAPAEYFLSGWAHAGDAAQLRAAVGGPAPRRGAGAARDLARVAAASAG